MPTLLIQTRRDTAANWANNNPILASGELALETDTGLFKFGNGTAAWNNLQYTTGGGPRTNLFVSSITFLNQKTTLSPTPLTSIIALSSATTPIAAFTSSINSQVSCYNDPAYKCNQIASNGSLYVAVGQGTSSADCIQWSSDFSSWHPSNLPISTLTEAKTVLWDGALWWTGGSGNATAPNAKLYNSHDGSNWTQVIANTTEIGPDTITDIAYNGANQYVIVGTGTTTNTVNTLAYSYISSQSILFDTTSTNAEQSTYYKEQYTSVKYLNGLYIAAGANHLLKSTDGSNWTPIVTNFGPGKVSIATNGASWLASGIDKTTSTSLFIQSTDGNTWLSSAPMTNTANFNKIAWTGNAWIATCGQVWTTSPDGSNWTDMAYNKPTNYVSALTGQNALFEPNVYTSSIYYTSSVLNSAPSVYGINPSKIRIVTATVEEVQTTLPSDELILISTSATSVTNSTKPTLVLDPTGFTDGQHIKLKLMANSQPVVVSSFATNPIDGSEKTHSMLLTNGTYKNLMYFQRTWYNLSTH